MQIRINRFVKALRFIISGAMNCAPTFKRKMLSPSVGARFIAPAIGRLS